MKYPERPTCHDDNYHAQRFDLTSWREYPNNDTHPGRHCSYCGSLHPEDLVQFIKNGASLGGADWKYGWPHKFYVNIPNPEPDKLFEISSANFKKEGKDWIQKDENTWVQMGTRSSLYGKWYNDHLNDEGFDEEAKNELIDLLHKHGGVKFSFKDGKLMYQAPHHNYQRF